jgi:hypothetical protein
MSEAGEALLGGIREAVDRMALPGTSDASRFCMQNWASVQRSWEL